MKITCEADKCLKATRVFDESTGFYACGGKLKHTACYLAELNPPKKTKRRKKK